MHPCISLNRTYSIKNAIDKSKDDGCHICKQIVPERPPLRKKHIVKKYRVNELLLLSVYTGYSTMYKLSQGGGYVIHAHANTKKNLSNSRKMMRPGVERHVL